MKLCLLAARKLKLKINLLNKILKDSQLDASFVSQIRNRLLDLSILELLELNKTSLAVAGGWKDYII